MKKTIIISLLVMLISSPIIAAADSDQENVIQSVCKGDLDNDGFIDASDINTLMMYLFINGDRWNGWLCPFFPQGYDLNDDGELDASDMSELIMFVFINGDQENGWLCPNCM